MEENNNKKALEIAEFAIRKAGEFLHLRSSLALRVVSQKSSRDELLTADIEAEKIIIQALEEHFPFDGILSEESGLIRENAKLRWIIDPLDGSFNYQHGDTVYGIMLGLVNGDMPLLSTIYLPELDEMVIAEKDKGIARNKKRVKVSTTSVLSKARVQFGDFAKDDRGQANEERIQDLRKLSGKVGRIRMVGSSAADFIAVATGVADGFVVRNPDPWDFLTGTLVIQEAQGIITKHSTPSGWLYVVSNGLIHNDLVHILTQ